MSAAPGECAGGQPLSQERDRGRLTWTFEEDEALKKLVEKRGARNWSVIAQELGGEPQRNGKSCRLRWFNQLDPNLNKRQFSEEENVLIVKAHAKLGNKWAAISKLLQGRTDNAVKNHWNSKLRKRAEDETTERLRYQMSIQMDGASKRMRMDTGSYMMSDAANKLGHLMHLQALSGLSNASSASLDNMGEVAGIIASATSRGGPVGIPFNTYAPMGMGVAGVSMPPPWGIFPLPSMMPSTIAPLPPKPEGAGGGEAEALEEGAVAGVGAGVTAGAGEGAGEGAAVEATFLPAPSSPSGQSCDSSGTGARPARSDSGFRPYSVGGGGVNSTRSTPPAAPVAFASAPPPSSLANATKDMAFAMAASKAHQFLNMPPSSMAPGVHQAQLQAQIQAQMQAKAQMLMPPPAAGGGGTGAPRGMGDIDVTKMAADAAMAAMATLAQRMGWDGLAPPAPQGRTSPASGGGSPTALTL